MVCSIQFYKEAVCKHNANNWLDNAAASKHPTTIVWFWGETNVQYDNERQSKEGEGELNTP